MECDRACVRGSLRRLLVADTDHSYQKDKPPRPHSGAMWQYKMLSVGDD